MTTLLRSSRFIRCLNAFTRRIITRNERNASSKILRIQACYTSPYLRKSYATVSKFAVRKSTPDHAPDFETLENSIQRSGRVFFQDVNAIVSKVKEEGHITSLDALLLIRCCGFLLGDLSPAQRNQKIKDIWEMLETLKTQIDISHINALLRVYLENDTNFNPIEFLTMLSNKDIKPNRITYQRLIMYYCKLGDIEGAMKILEFMKDNKIPLNDAVFNSLIIGHSQADDLKSAENILNVMKATGVTPTTGTYTALMTAYAKRGDMAMIKKVLNEIAKIDLIFQDQDYFEVIYHLAANNHNDNIDEIMEMMKKGPNYNLDCVQICLRILDTGNYKAALKIVESMKQPKLGDNGTFVIRKMVSSLYPAEQVIEVCKTLRESGTNDDAFLIAFKRSIHAEKVDLCLTLMNAWKEESNDIREHYFWPLLIIEGCSSNYQGIINILKTMTDMNVKISVETITNYVLPFTAGKWDDIVRLMTNLNVPFDIIMRAITCKLLKEWKTKNALKLMLDFVMNHDPEDIYRCLAVACQKTQDYESCVFMLRIIANPPTADDSTPERTSSFIINTGVKNILDEIKNQNVTPQLQMLINELVKNGMNLSSETTEIIRELFGNEITPEIIKTLDTLSSGNLQLLPLPISENSDKLRSFSERNEVHSLRTALNLAMKNGDLEEAESYVEKLESMDIPWTTALVDQVIRLYCIRQNVEKADKLIQKTMELGITLKPSLRIKYARLLVRNDQMDDAIKFIRTMPCKEVFDGNDNFIFYSLEDVFKASGNVAKTKEFYEALEESNYFEPKANILGALVKIHLENNDVDGALETFESIFQKYRVIAYKKPLCKKLIELENATALQQVTDLNAEIYGENNSLIDLGLIFIECGHLRQARKIMETPGLQFKGSKLENCISILINGKRHNLLNDFFEVVRGLSLVDTRELYDTVIKLYANSNNWEDALNLWTNIQEEDVTPSQFFLIMFDTLMKKNGQPSPCVIDGNKLGVNADKKNVIELQNKPRDNSSNNHTLNNLVAMHLKDNNYKKAIDLIDDHHLKYGKVPRYALLCEVWEALMEAGDEKRLHEHGTRLSEEIKEKLSFDVYLKAASLKEEDFDSFISELVQKYETHGRSVVRKITTAISLPQVYKYLKTNENSAKKFTPIALQFFENGIYLPVNTLWCAYFSTNNPEADNLWDNYVSTKPFIFFRNLMKECVKENNIELAERTFEKISEHTMIRAKSKLWAREQLIQLYTNNDQLEKAIKILPDLSQNEAMSFKNGSAYRSLQKAFRNAGKEFPSSLTISTDEKMADLEQANAM